MALVNNSLYNDISNIIKQAEQKQFYNLLLEISVGGELLDNKTTFLKSITYVEDYFGSIGDDIQCEVMIPEGIYFEKLLSNDSDIKVTVKYIPVIKEVNKTDSNRKIIITKYTGILIQRSMEGMIGSSPPNVSFSAASISNLVSLHLQFIDITLESMLGVSLGTNVMNSTVENALRSLLTFASKSKKEKTFSDTPFLGCDIYPANNDKVYDAIVIDSGTDVTGLAYFLQNTIGIYSGGISQYFTRGHWYVYPTYHTGRYHETEGTLTVLDMPPNKMPHTETSYVHNEKETIILATGKTLNNSPTTERLYNVGSGTRFADGASVLEGKEQFKDGYVTTDRSTNVTEFLHDDRYGKRSIARMSNNKTTTNPYREYSKLAPTITEQVDFEWHNSQVGLVYPGMPCRMLYQKENKTIIRYGVVGRITTHTAASTKSVMDKVYSTNSVVTLILASEIEEK